MVWSGRRLPPANELNRRYAESGGLDSDQNRNNVFSYIWAKRRRSEATSRDGDPDCPPCPPRPSWLSSIPFLLPARPANESVCFVFCKMDLVIAWMDRRMIRYHKTYTRAYTHTRAHACTHVSDDGKPWKGIDAGTTKSTDVCPSC